MLPESPLTRVELPVLGKPLKRRNTSAVHEDREHCTRLDRLPLTVEIIKTEHAPQFVVSHLMSFPISPAYSLM